MNSNPTQNSWSGATAFISVKDKLPPVGQRVVVATPFACYVGFLGPWGVWREAHDSTRIEQVESWHPVDPGNGAPTHPRGHLDEQSPVEVTEGATPRQ